MSLYVQYGAGLCCPEGWLNFDASPMLRLKRLPLLGHLLSDLGTLFPPAMRYGDIIRGLPLEDASVMAVYCSHVLEHLALEDCRVALRQTLRLLRPGGRFRLVVPDLAWSVQVYLRDVKADAAPKFLRETMLGETTRAGGLMPILREVLGSSRHRWMWDYDSLGSELERAGFVRIRRATVGDSGDPRFDAVESPERWENALGIECFREGAQ